MTRRHWLYLHLILLLAFTCWLTGCAWGEDTYAVQVSSSVVDCWRTNPKSHSICMEFYRNEDGDFYAYRSIEIRYNGRHLPPFGVQFSTSNVVGFNERLEAYKDIAEALNEAHRHREIQEYTPGFIPDPVRTREICAETFGCKFDGEVCSCENETKIKAK